MSGLRYEFYKDWRITPHPEWFNHEMDLAFFEAERKPHFFERGVYLQEVARGRVLDLCCGDGSVTALFLAPKAEHVIGLDIDPDAIASAKSKFASIPNLEFGVQDIRTISFPENSFDLICWDAAIEFLPRDDVQKVLEKLKTYLKPDGMLVGSSLAPDPRGKNPDHEFDFEDTHQLQAFLKPYFSRIVCWNRHHADRINFYFRCTNHPTLNLNMRDQFLEYNASSELR